MATPRSQRIGVLIAAIVAVFFTIGIPFLRWLSGVWIDWLWYGDLGQRSVFVTRIGSQIVTGLVFGLATFVLLYVNLRIARRMAPKAVPIGLPEGTPEQLEIFIDALRGRMGPILDKAVLWGCLALAFFNGLGMSTQWQTFRIALASVPFPYNDPQFNRNVGFFVFNLPAYNALSNWLSGVLILTAILTFAVHVIDGAIQPWAKFKGFAPHVKAHLSVLMAFIVLAWGFRYWISIWELNYSTRGQIVGAGYTDVHAQLPAYWILIVVSIVTALALLLNIRYKGWRLPLTALGVWVAVSILLGAVWPGLMQQFIVAPNEASAETPYIERNIEMTRKAFGLTDVKGQKFPATENLTPADIVADRQTLKNVRLWDPGIVAQSYSQLQSLRPYYEFPDVDVDRYTIDGVRQQVLVSAREMNSALLPSTAQTWVNRPPRVHARLRTRDEPGQRGRPARDAQVHHRRCPAQDHDGPRDQAATHLLRRGDHRLRGRRYRHQGVRLPARRAELLLRVQGHRRCRHRLPAEEARLGAQLGIEPSPVLAVREAREPRADPPGPERRGSRPWRRG